MEDWDAALKRVNDDIAAAHTWLGKRVEQVRAEAPEYQKFVGRVGTVDDVTVDEKGEAHCRTAEDLVWCPARLLVRLTLQDPQI